MPSTLKNGRTGKHKVGYMAVSYSPIEDYWFSSEGVFCSGKDAKEDVEDLWDVDSKTTIVVKVRLTK